MNANIASFESREKASARAAQLLGDALILSLKEQPNSTLVVSGGSTPRDCFRMLSNVDLPWHRVEVTLTDERCVPADHPERNERTVRSLLLRNRAAEARFVTIDAVQPAPFAAVLLGMGSDGHFASLFPDADNLASGLDLHNPLAAINITTAASPHPRISMTLQRLLRTRQLVLLAFGDDKRAILQEPAGYPVAGLLNNQSDMQNNNSPMHLLWAK